MEIIGEDVGVVFGRRDDGKVVGQSYAGWTRDGALYLPYDEIMEFDFYVLRGGPLIVFRHCSGDPLLIGPDSLALEKKQGLYIPVISGIARVENIHLLNENLLLRRREFGMEIPADLNGEVVNAALREYLEEKIRNYESLNKRLDLIAGNRRQISDEVEQRWGGIIEDEGVIKE